MDMKRLLFCLMGMNIKPILHKKSFLELTTDELYELLRVRSEVFVVEQNCVYQDMDGDDQKSIHLWLTVDDKVDTFMLDGIPHIKMTWTK